MLPRGCPCPVGKVAAYSGSYGFARDLGAPKAPSPLSGCPLLFRAQGTLPWGDNHCATLPGLGSLVVPGKASIPSQKQPWHGFSWQIRTPSPNPHPVSAARMGPAPPAALRGENSAGRDTAVAPPPCPSLRHPGGTQPAPVPSRPGMWRQRRRLRESCQGPETRKGRRISPALQRKQGRERGRRGEEASGTRGRARHHPRPESAGARVGGSGGDGTPGVAPDTTAG